MLDALRKLRDLLNRRERRRALLLFAMIVVMGFVESTRVASIVPFVAVLAEPSVVETNPYLMIAYQRLGFRSTDDFLVFLGLGLFVIVVLTLAYTALITWATLRFTAARNYTLSRRLFESYLSRPYEWFLRRHSADLGKSVLSEVSLVIGGALMPLMQLITQGIVAAFLIVLLLLVDPLLAVIVTSGLAGVYLAVFWASRLYLTRIGEDRRLANLERYRISGEAFGGIKDVKMLGLEPVFLRRFEGPSLRFVKHQAASDVIGQLPQYALQAIAFAIVLVIVWYQVLVRDNLAQALPVIALYALAGSRLMPALQRVYQSVSKLRFSMPALDALHRDLVERPRALSATHADNDGAGPLGLHDRLEVQTVSYCYPGSQLNALDGVSMMVPARGAVGLVGRTGAGKTTLVDVILGLLEPQSGQILVDGKPIDAGNKRAWQRSIGYVPQQIFLADDSIAANIAFGIAPADIDMAAVERSARIANLDEFVTKELESGYATLIGERGVRLSGGQRQRVGIARALYRDPDLLIMDEGTSALDNITERAVMDAVNNLAHRKTIILIAHRLTTVKRCDTIFLLDHGRVTASGHYDELVAGNERFREMVDSSLG